ncbi:hypothetical protein KEM60_02951 [Austwickia sp. TVS 96-490-7B]|uniref:hypothetical protein n=1 Tax=Austwickia sp. TVS 96-490-7B TaxID=2830843 RepID=UPI001C576786|nr:hypothetical protein [Austwickia sp. TVS 96-490-7B]MBW3086722.1 hypothetical protein [Austwickia sp. TVS 96-490-7B]
MADRTVLPLTRTSDPTGIDTYLDDGWLCAPTVQVSDGDGERVHWLIPPPELVSLI